MFAWLAKGAPNSDKCLTQDICAKERALTYRSLHEEENGELVYLARNDWRDDWTLNFCDECADDAQAQFKQGSEKLWEELPAHFGLPSWEALGAAEKRSMFSYMRELEVRCALASLDSIN
jgi:hypothetical protein